MPAIDLHPEALGPEGEPCRSCGAPLAGDQRYCLHCGERRGPARVDWRAIAAAPPAPIAAAVPPASWSPSLPSPRAVAAGALLLLGFGVFAGTLAGPKAGDTLADAAPVIVVRAAAPPAPVPAAPVPAPAAPTVAAPATAAPPSAPAPAPVATPVESAPVTSTAPASTAPPSGGGGGGGGGAGQEAPPARPSGPAVKHVWVITLADHSFDDLSSPARAASAQAPYLTGTLQPKGLLLPNYYAIAHGALADGIAMISGQGPNPDTRADCPTYADFRPWPKAPLVHGQEIGGGCVFPAGVKTLPDQLAGSGHTWKAYVEDVDKVAPGQPDSCRHPQLGRPDPYAAPRPGDAYLTWRDPFVYFHSIVDSPDCAESVVGLGHLPADLAATADTPDVSFVIPNACHDGRDAPCAAGAPAGLASADSWLRSVVEPILASKAYADGGLVVITFDQASPNGPSVDSRASTAASIPYPNTPAPAGAGGGRVGALVLSPFVKAGTTDDTEYDHFSLLRTIEERFGLDPLGYAGRKGERGFGDDVWRGAAP